MRQRFAEIAIGTSLKSSLYEAIRSLHSINKNNEDFAVNETINEELYQYSSFPKPFSD